MDVVGVDVAEDLAAEVALVNQIVVQPVAEETLSEKRVAVDDRTLTFFYSL